MTTPTTDRELLELAAKALGCLVAPGRVCGLEGRLSHPRGDGLLCDNDFYWNPLTDDGDALRLAVKLGLGVDHAAMRSWAWRSWGTPTVLAQEEFHDKGKDAATRRAIVRAAAEIGRSM